MSSQSANEYSLTRIIQEYGEQTDLLKLVLAAKTEEDRARAEYEKRLQEELKFETRRLEFEMMLHSNMFRQQELSRRPAFHHPDTPGGPAGERPFAFFKTPAGGPPIHHPSALPPPPPPLPPVPPQQQQQQQQHQQQPRANLSVSTKVRHEDKGPVSAPVDGGNRRISHDEVILALRRKVMNKQSPAKPLVVNTAEDTSSSSSETSPSVVIQQAQQKKKKPRVSSSSISHIVHEEREEEEKEEQVGN